MPNRQDRSTVARARQIANRRGYRALTQWIREPLALRGEWVEIVFCARAAAHGLTVTKTWGHAHAYDVITEINGRFARIQIKGTAAFNGKAFVVSTRPRQGSPAYAANAFEFFAYYIVPMNLWYIIPKSIADKNKKKAKIALRPHVLKARYSQYLENWELLKHSQYVVSR